jgi:hypothetical protein
MGAKYAFSRLYEDKVVGRTNNVLGFIGVVNSIMTKELPHATIQQQSHSSFIIKT